MSVSRANIYCLNLEFRNNNKFVDVEVMIDDIYISC